MLLLSKTGLFSPAGVSMAGGVAHNIGQVTMASLVTSTVKIFLYLPVLLISGTITGLLLGIAASMVLERMGHLRDSSILQTTNQTEGDD